MQHHLLYIFFLKVVFMAQARRVKLSANQRTDMWGRWKAGQSLHEIGRAFGKDHVSIQFMLSQHGGIVPTALRRSLLTLTLAEREDISRGFASGSSLRYIAKGLERAVSTVSREVARHGRRPRYRASEADHQAWESALRPKACLLALHVKLQKIVAGKLILDWSPKQRQRGTNENTNGLLRQYFPRRTGLSVYSQAELDKVALRLNGRPRKTLGFETPASRLQASVASTH
jgi:IS30 family transposase